MCTGQALRIVSLLGVLGLGWVGAAQAQTYYSIVSGGGQLQLGHGLPFPLQPSTSSMGGKTSMGGPIGTGMNFPDKLLIPLNTDPAKRLVKQTAGPDPKQITVPPGVFRRKAAGPMTLGVALNNPKIFQVRTNLSFTAPGFASAMFKAGGRTGAAIQTFFGTPAGSIARYTKTAAQFGGPAMTKELVASPVRVWANALSAKLPCKNPAFGGGNASCFAYLIAAYPNSMVAAGGVANNVQSTPGVPVPMTPGKVAVSVPNLTGMISMSKSTGKTGLSNMAVSSGFPWTTGKITLSQPKAIGAPEKFTITGSDQRGKGTNPPGVGTLSLVSGSLSNRTKFGPQSNRSWARYTLPEPNPVLGALGALAMLGVCHGLVRRRSR
jgi:hypothetical protein